MSEEKKREAPRRPGWLPDLSHLPPGYAALWVITVVSLIINLIVLRQMVVAFQAARQAIYEAIAVIDDLQTTTVTTNVHIDDTITLNTDLPIEGTIPVLIEETLPIDTTITVPVNFGPLGTYDAQVPIRGSFDVTLDQSIAIDQAFHVSALIPIQLDVPVSIRVQDTALGGTLDEIKARLLLLADRLERPLFPPPPAPTSAGD